MGKAEILNATIMLYYLNSSKSALMSRLANLNNCGEARGQKRVVGKALEGDGDGHKRDLGVGGLVNRM